MRQRLFLATLVLLATASFGLGQSLSEVAKQEKERRKKIKESGTEVQVITDRELASNQGRIANPSSSETPSEGTATTESTGTAASSTESSSETTRTAPSIRDELNRDEEQPATNIPADASLEEKLRLLERMKASYQQQVATIDAQIEKNNQRLAEIQDELVSTGGTGLPTAPRADFGVRNPADVPALRNEQQELQQQNQALEAQKRSAKEDIITRARRAGIPGSYLNF